MKRSKIVLVAFLTYLVALTGMFFGVDNYIESKDDRLRKEIHDKLHSIFKDRQQYIDVAYSGKKVGYEKDSIPAKPNPSKFKNVETNQIDHELYRSALDGWTDKYGNLTKMYRIHYKRSDWSGSYDFKDGWNLCMLEYDYDGVYQTWLFPYAVGYIKQDHYFGNSYLPSVQSAVDEAFEYYTTDKNSTYFSKFEKGSIDRAWSEIYKAENEYYFMSKDETPRFSRTSFPLFENYSNDGKSYAYQRGYMYNDYYKVFLASSQPTTWTIRKWKGEPDIKEKKDLWMYWTIGLSILLSLVVVPICIIDVKHKKIKNESLHAKLMRLCNPSNFMKGNNYNKDKVDKANAIYKRLLEVSPEDIDALNELQQIAVSDLGINLIDSEKLEELKQIVNPQKYMKPYNPDKIAIANELYAILSKDNLTFSELLEVENKAKEL